MRAGNKRNSAQISLCQKRRYDPTGNFLDVSLGKDLIASQVPLDES